MRRACSVQLRAHIDDFICALFGHGTVSKSAVNRWVTKGLVQISDGRVGLWEGELDWAARVWNGRISVAG